MSTSLAGNIYTVYDLAGASDRRGSDARCARKNKEDKNEEGRAKVKPSRFTGREFYGVTHRRRKTTALLLSILAIEIGCLLIDIRLSRDNLNDTRVGRVEDTAVPAYADHFYARI